MLPTNSGHDDLVGATIAGRYRIISPLGAGGMGVAYRAWDIERGTPVVVKVPKRPLLQTPQFAERFAREMRLLNGISHDFVVPIIDVGEHDGLPYVVMRFLPGGSLADRRLRDEQGRPKANPPGMLHLWLPQIATALDHIHALGVVHRDVKPENIFFDAHWGAFLGDFGIAKVVEESDKLYRDSTLTATSMTIGTHHYMAPEQFTPKAVIDGRTDQYALALTVYELLSGERPFRGEDANLIVEVLTMPPPPLPSRRRGLPRPLVAAVHKALSKRSEERFATCRAFVDAALADVPPLPDQPDVARLMCPRCGNILKLRSNAAGRTGKCPKCKAAMRVARDLESLWLMGEEGDTTSSDTRTHRLFRTAPRAQLPTWASGTGWLIAAVLPMGMLVMTFSPNRPVHMPPTAVEEAAPVAVSAEPERAEDTQTTPPESAPTEPSPRDRMAEARNCLDRDPDNPVAHGILGRFHCFIDERWDQGLDHLAKCETLALATVAREELATRSTDVAGRPGAVLEAAQAWWRLKTGGLLPEAESNAIGRHAVALYHGALAQLMTDRDIAAANAWLDADEAFRIASGNTRPTAPRPTPAPESRSAAAPEKAEPIRSIERQPQIPVPPAVRAPRSAEILARPPLENSIGMKLKLLPPGTFKMGSDDGDPDEMPIHTVRLTREFFLGVNAGRKVQRGAG